MGKVPGPHCSGRFKPSHSIQVLGNPGQGPRLRPRGGEGAEGLQVGQEQEEQKAGSSRGLERVPKVNPRKASSGVRSKGPEEGCGWERTRWPWNAVGAAGPEMSGLERPHRASGMPAAKVWLAGELRAGTAAWCAIRSCSLKPSATRKHRPPEGDPGAPMHSALLCSQHRPRTDFPHLLLTDKRPCQGAFGKANFCFQFKGLSILRLCLPYCWR